MFRTIQYSTYNPKHRRTQVLAASHQPQSQWTEPSHYCSSVPQPTSSHWVPGHSPTKLYKVLHISWNYKIRKIFGILNNCEKCFNKLYFRCFTFHGRKQNSKINMVKQSWNKMLWTHFAQGGLLFFLKSKSVDVEYFNTVISSTTCKLQPFTVFLIIMSSSALMMSPTQTFHSKSVTLAATKRNPYITAKCQAQLGMWL